MREQINRQTFVPRLLGLAPDKAGWSAPGYCGIGIALFERECPIPPIRIGNRKLWDIRFLDVWIDMMLGLRPAKEGIDLLIYETYGLGAQSHGQNVAADLIDADRAARRQRRNIAAEKIREAREAKRNARLRNRSSPERQTANEGAVADPEEGWTVNLDAINTELAKMNARAREGGKQARAQKAQKPCASGPVPSISDVFAQIDARKERQALAKRNRKRQQP